MLGCLCGRSGQGQRVQINLNSIHVPDRSIQDGLRVWVCMSQGRPIDVEERTAEARIGLNIKLKSNDAGAWLCPPWFDRQPRRSITQNVPAPSDPSNFNITHDRARRADRQSARPAVLDRVRTHRQQAG